MLNFLTHLSRYEETENGTTIIGIANDTYLNDNADCDFSGRVLLVSKFRYSKKLMLHAVKRDINVLSNTSPIHRDTKLYILLYMIIFNSLFNILLPGLVLIVLSTLIVRYS